MRLYNIIFRLISRIQFVFDLKQIEMKKNTFFMVLMPGTLHVSILAIKKFPKDNNLILIANGLTQKELNYLAEMKLHILISKTILHHHNILNILFKHWKHNFGLIDNDCFIFDTNLVPKLSQIDEQQLLSTCFAVPESSKKTRHFIPETFLVFFNIKNCQYLMRKYKINSKIYFSQTLPRSIRNLFKKNTFSYPEEGKNYYDTLRVLFLLGHLENLKFKKVNLFTNLHGDIKSVYHIGGLSKPQNFTKNAYGFTGTYFWVRLIELIDDIFLEECAREKFDYPSSNDLLAQSKYSAFLPENIEMILKKILTVQ